MITKCRCSAPPARAGSISTRPLRRCASSTRRPALWSPARPNAASSRIRITACVCCAPNWSRSRNANTLTRFPISRATRRKSNGAARSAPMFSCPIRWQRIRAPRMKIPTSTRSWTAILTVSSTLTLPLPPLATGLQKPDPAPTKGVPRHPCAAGGLSCHGPLGSLILTAWTRLDLPGFSQGILLSNAGIPSGGAAAAPGNWKLFQTGVGLLNFVHSHLINIILRKSSALCPLTGACPMDDRTNCVLTGPAARLRTPWFREARNLSVRRGHDARVFEWVNKL